MTIEIHRETEIKVKIASREEIRARISAAGFRPLGGRHLERNWVFDFPDCSLKRRGVLLRLRQSGAECLLTLKTPVRGRMSGYKVRDEAEVQLADRCQAEIILRGIGLELFFTYEKYREVFCGQNVRLMVDETPMGDYLEVEGTPAAIDDACRALGFGKGDYIVATYFQLFRASGGKGDMVFRQ